MKESRKQTILAIIGNIIFALLIGGIASYFIKDNLDIYSQLKQPAGAPPSVLFPIVWTILYILMGISAGLVMSASKGGKTPALIIYFIQLALNFIWSPIFFNLKAFGLALIIIILLWLMVLAMIIAFNRVSRPAALLQIPYFLWLTFAAYLNLMLILLN